MEDQQKTNSFKKLLDRLQEDSWQLELLISGFAIFGLFYALDPIAQKLHIASFDNNQVFVNFFVIVHFSLQILIFNLLFHVLLRGLWIGSLGMRYVFGDINYEKLNYSERFKKFLTKKVGSFDDYIRKLENICSVIFAISFLLVFYIFSFFIICFIAFSLNSDIPDWSITLVQIFSFVFLLGTLLVFIDFMTLGLLKKNRILSLIYFPFYRVFSLLTLSYLYRPLVYNLLDNKLGRRISFVLIPFYLLIYVVFHLNFQKSNFITREYIDHSSSSIANARNYEDVMDKNESTFYGEFIIQSRVIKDPYLKVFVPLKKSIEDSLISFNPSIKPKKDQRGLHFQSEVNFMTFGTEEQNFSNGFLNTFEEYFSFKIDTTNYETDFVVSYMVNQVGFETYIGLKDLSEGKHVIEFQHLERKGSETVVSIRKVPFWYFKD